MKTIVEITELDCSLVVSYSIAEPRSYQKESGLKK